MEKVLVEFMVPKESKEVVDALMEVYDFVKAGKELTQIGELFDDLSIAVSGFDQIKGEMNSELRDELAGYLVRELLSRLMPYEPPAEA